MRSYVGSQDTTRPLLLSFISTLSPRKKEQHDGDTSIDPQRSGDGLFPNTVSRV